MSFQGLDNSVVVEAQLREARLMGALEHPAIAPMHGVALKAQGALCFTMKLVQGHSLAQILRELPADVPHGRDRLLDLVDVVVKVCDALSYAHARGVVHCDVKASNVVVGEHGQVYVMDWGVTRVVGEGALRDLAYRPADGRAPGRRPDLRDPHAMPRLQRGLHVAALTRAVRDDAPPRPIG